MSTLFSTGGDFFHGHWFKKWRPYLVIFILAFGLYGQTLFFGYTNLDDNILVTRSDIFNSFKNIGAIFSTDALFSSSKLYYRPLLNLSYLLDIQWGGPAIFFHHLGNIVSHFLAVGLVFIFLKKLIKNESLALGLSLFLLLHPALVQAVAWIPGRNDSLLTIFILAAFLSWLDFSRRRRPLAFWGYLVFFFLALLTKETAVFLPFLVIIYWLTIGRKDGLPRADKALIIFGSIGVGFVWLLMRQLALAGGERFILSAVLSGLPTALLTAFKMSSQTIWPFPQAILAVSADFSAIRSLIIWAILVGVLAVSRQKKNEYLLFGLAWFIIFFLMPFVFSADAYFDHRLYLPLIGFLIMLSEIDWIKNLNWRNKKVIGGTIIILALLVSWDLSRSLDFRDALSFSRAAVKSSPHSWMAHGSLGVVYSDSQAFSAATEELRQALVLNPSVRLMHYNLGLVYFRQKKWTEAENEWQQELLVNPDYYKALTGLGDAYYQEGRWAEAADYWRAAVQVSPGDPEAAANLKNLIKPAEKIIVN